jgi:hypothetical protein
VVYIEALYLTDLRNVCVEHLHCTHSDLFSEFIINAWYMINLMQIGLVSKV